VADGEQRRVGIGGDGVEQREGRRLPRGVLADALGVGRETVVAVRVEVAGTAGAEVDVEAPARRLGEHAVVAHREGDHAQGETRGGEPRQQVAARLQHGMDERVVAEVRPTVVEVEDGDVDDLVVDRRQVVRRLDPGILERAGCGRRAVGHAEVASQLSLVAAGNRHGGLG
jgi:hypothetical protein